MLTRRHRLTPLAAVVSGLLAGVVGTVAMDTFRYLAYRRTGGKDRPLAWEFAPVDTWAQAPDPGQVAKRVVEGFTQRELPERYAWRVSTAAHWGYGAGWGAVYGILAGSLRHPNPLLGLPFGAAVWGSDYAALPQSGLYQPIWEYDARTLGVDLAGHLCYGVGTSAAFWLLTRCWGRPRRK